MSDKFIFEENYRVRAYEIDQNKRITTPALMRLMHETALQQVIQMKMSVWDLEPHKISWVLIRLKLQVHSKPILGEEINIRTKPMAFEKVFTFRDYRVYDTDNNLLAEAHSTWILMDTEKRSMTRIPPFILELDIPKTSKGIIQAAAKLPKFSKVDKELSFSVNWYDLDFNRHLNNMFYLQWMLESTSVEVLNKKELKEINLIYKLEAHFGEALLSQSEQIEEDTFLHRLVRQKDGKEIAQAQSIWK